MFQPIFIAKKLLTALILPPSGLVLLLLTGFWLHRRSPRGGRILIALALSLLLLLSLPIVENQLLRSLEQTPPISPAELNTAQAIIVLGGGSYPNAPEYEGDTVGRHSLSRLRYAARLHKISTLPLLVSGGAPFGGRPEAESMRQVLNTEFNIAVRWSEPNSADTAENAANSAALLRHEGIQRIVLVTDSWHMPRALIEFRRQGLDVIAAPTGFATNSASWIEQLLPQAHALYNSSLALHEWLGLFAQHFTKPPVARL